MPFWHRVPKLMLGGWIWLPLARFFGVGCVVVHAWGFLWRCVEEDPLRSVEWG